METILELFQEWKKCQKDCIKTLLGVSDSAEPFITENVNRCQFIREVIEKEPKYRPFNSITELIEHWEKNYGNSNRPKGTMPLIWIRPKTSDGSMKEALLVTEYWSDGVCSTYSQGTISWESLFNEFEFLDGKTCGVEVEE